MRAAHSPEVFFELKPELFKRIEMNLVAQPAQEIDLDVEPVDVFAEIEYMGFYLSVMVYIGHPCELPSVHLHPAY